MLQEIISEQWLCFFQCFRSKISLLWLRFVYILKGQCPNYAHTPVLPVFSSKDNRTVILTRQDFLPDLLIINKYWMRLSRPIICLSLQLWCWQIIIFCNNWVQKLFYHLITKIVFNEYLWEAKQSALSCNSDRKKEKSLVSFMHEQNIICSQTHLDDIVHEQTIICRQVTWWALSQWKGTKICIEWYTCMAYHACICNHCIKFENKLLPPRTSRSYAW